MNDEEEKEALIGILIGAALIVSIVSLFVSK